MFETLDLLDSIAADDPGPLARARMQADADDRREALAAEQRAEARQVAASERAEVLALQNRALGDPMGGLSSARSQLMADDDLVSELRGKLEKAQARQERARENVEFFATRAQMANDASMRSVPMYQDPAEQACQRAQIALDDARREGRRTLERARQQVQARRGTSFRSAVPAGAEAEYRRAVAEIEAPPVDNYADRIRFGGEIVSVR